MITIYTDGACSGNPGPGGWGAVILFPTCKQEMSGFNEATTNNRMELTAVIKALRLVTKIRSKEKILVHSDSAYVINAINNHWVAKWMTNDWQTIKGEEVKNKDLWIKLVKILYKNKNISFIKIKGHSGNKYNELADQLAKKEIERNL